ncbi:hypothetical protein Nepgr_030737 [Nepenthes gracilis]|uniref:C2H2-type domain-containing protein n=1 Tax=Nepenthes gracilis TaxID=150966 RepID=A0AAD3TGX4_NEPGR|nr:hypothetical protein Nepgr_030737 [Nepenthes gracilis]
MHRGMSSFLKKSNSLLKKYIGRPQSLVQLSSANRFSHHPCLKSSNPLITSVQKPVQIRVGIFWDLDNKPPNSVTPYEAATRLKGAAISFGVVRYMFAYANRHAFSHVPLAVREQRKDRKLINQLENKGVIKPLELYLCRVCGRKFHTNEKLLNHFKIHEREHQKRLNQIESAKGKRRVNLVGKYAMKMEKYQYASRDILTPKEGYGLADDLKRAGFHVQTVSDKPQAADAALRNHMVDMMDHTQLDCVVLVSDDSDFVGVLKEAKERSVKTVVVGDFNDGVLKRNADACFSWREILMGKAKKEVVSIVGRWKDRDVLKRLEWSYDPLLERVEYGSDHEREVDYVASSDDELENPMDMEDDTPIDRR